MSKSAICLEIPKEWRVWSGYKNNWIEDGDKPNHMLFIGTKPTFAHLDPVDHDSYDETSAFPTAKPDIDVFCPPCRTRSQRGWYHAKAFPTPFVPTWYHLPFRTGADLPPELLTHLLNATDENSTLRACALVNRYWAGVCQKRLWTHVTLHSRENALQLLSFLGTPESHIRRYLRNVEFRDVEHKFSGMPWFHLVSRIYEKLGQDPRPTLQLKIQGPLAKNRGSLRSIHQGLPHIPPHFSWPISRLHLSDVRFVRLSDLMHLVWEIRHLRQLVCTRIDWGKLPTNLLRASVSNKDRFIHRFEMSECSPDWAQAAVLLSARLRCQQFRFFSDEDLNSALAVAKAFEQGVIGGSYSALISTSGFSLGCKPDSTLELRQVTPQVYWRSGPAHTPNPGNVPGNAKTWHIVTLAISMPEHTSLRPQFNWKNVDWKALSQVIPSFRALRALVLGFSSTEEVEQFVTTIVDGPMQPVFDGGKLKYAVWDPTSKSPLGSWLKVSPGDLESKEDSRTELLWKVYA